MALFDVITPYSLGNWLTYGDEDSLTHRPRSTPPELFYLSLLLNY
jgi:hypothetical protein